jgi:hypothetical protein
MESSRLKPRTALAALATILAFYGAIAYVLLPLAWTHYEHQKGTRGPADADAYRPGYSR